MSSWRQPVRRTMMRHPLPQPEFHPADRITQSGLLSPIHSLHPDAWITFLIPSIGRRSLQDTLASLQAQRAGSPPWIAIVLLDGCSMPLIPIHDSRICVLPLPRLGHAGLVRNEGISLVYTPWIAFVDDDDQLHSDYLLTLQHEIQQTPYASCVLFRMISTENGILPDQGGTAIQSGQVGISFAIHSSVSVRFTADKTEDYQFLKELDRQRAPIVLSSHVMYSIRGAPFPSDAADDHALLPRIVFHPLT